MGHVNIRIKIMPSLSSVNLDEIKSDFKKIIESHDGKGCSFSEEPIAFGLKAVIATFIYPEEKEFEPVENKLEKIKNVSSIQMIDMRRAL